MRTHTMGVLCRLLLDREIVMDHNLIHIIHDIMSKVIDRTEGDGDENVGGFLINRVTYRADAACWPLR